MAVSVIDALHKFFDNATYPILFTGAGVSVHAGLPTWKALVEMLAEGIRSADPLTTQQMLEYARSGDYTRAVDYFRLSGKVLEGDKEQLLVKLLSTFNAPAIEPVAALPVNAYLTTNFDRSLLETVAVARGQVARDYRYGDRSFKQAQWERGLFVARIHGAIEMPDSIVLSEQQFIQLLADDTYAELLGACFLHRNLLFVGFSFYDPAVRHVFNELNKRFGAAPPGRHMALLPGDAGSEFIQRASRLNLEVVTYDPLNNHAALWAGIAAFRPATVGGSAPSAPSKAAPFASTKHFLAACYARAQTQHASITLRTAVLEGILSAMLQEIAPNAIGRTDLLERVRTTLGLKGRDAESVLDAAIKALVEAGLCRRLKAEGGRGFKLAWIGETDESGTLDAAIAVLVRSVRNRASVQEGWQTSTAVDEVVTALFGHLIRRRGWDLGAAFAAGRPPEAVAVESVVQECASKLPTFDRQRLVRIFQGLFQRPTEEEARILGELGRLSFAVELAFQSPRSVLLHDAILPRQIYFDASVLLPAIVPGHPFSAVYLDAIGRLKKAAADAAVDLQFRVCTVYLNEIISHRANAEEYSSQTGKSFPLIARSDALFHGVTNVNVFVGAYANWVNAHKEVPFDEFLRRFAPYANEMQLRSWLKSRGFEVVSSPKAASYSDFYSLLETAYADKFARGKGPILIEHDATQLSILNQEMRKAEKALFITADRRLQEVVERSKYAHVSDIMMSHVGLVQFIDLLVGGINDGVALTELLWSARVSDRGEAVRSYFTARGLEQYDDGMAMAMPEIIDRFADQAATELQRVGADLASEEPKKRAEGFRLLGSLEKNYFSGMSDAVDKLRQRLERED